MDEQRNSPTTPGPDQLPDLARDLARLADPQIEVPQSVDDAVMAAARTAKAETSAGTSASAEASFSSGSEPSASSFDSDWLGSGAGSVSPSAVAARALRLQRIASKPRTRLAMTAV